MESDCSCTSWSTTGTLSLFCSVEELSVEQESNSEVSVEQESCSETIVEP